MDLNKKLELIESMLQGYVIINKPLNFKNDNELNIVLDIEACPSIPFSMIKHIEDKSQIKAITYSIAIMICDDDSDYMYWYNNVEECLRMLLNLKCKKVNIFIHNLSYDIKPFATTFIEKFGATQQIDEIVEKEEYNIFEGKQEKIRELKPTKEKEKNSNTFNMLLKNGQLYKFTMNSKNIWFDKKRNESQTTLEFRDTLKLVPLKLSVACSSFLGLNLSKDGLDYEKVRNVNDILNFKELKYIYEDVFGLKYLVKLLVIDGFECFGKTIKYTKMTSSSQSLDDFKHCLLEDYEKKQNCFENENFRDYVENGLYKTSFFSMTKSDNKTIDKKADLLFSIAFPSQNTFVDAYIRNSYYGGLSTVDFDNVKKFSKRKVKKGKVFDVNSLYPFTMKTFLLPFGNPIINKNTPYQNMNENYKKAYPLYIQQITIHSMKVKKGKMEFVQVKDRCDFNGNDVLKENKNLKGEKVSITLDYCSPLFELLFENYDVESYELGGHIAFQGVHKIFDNYLDFWAMVKQNSSGANRQIAKLRQNALYGKFGTNGESQQCFLFSDNDKFSIKYNKESYYGDNVYLPLATFITSWAKSYLVHAINANRNYFMYCDTDSIHLFDDDQEVKGIEIDGKKYGAWDNEMNFNDFVYLGSKRYAEKDIKSGEWEIKCCGLTDTIMKSIKDINVFTYCELSQKEINKRMKNDTLYTKNDDNYYYKEPECINKIKGLIKSKKSKIVSGGTLIIEQPYAIREKYRVFR